MSESLSSLDKLKSFLNKLFQFESQDLDFGIYKILHYKRKEVKQFIDDLLVREVKKQLNVFEKETTEKLQHELGEFEKDETISNYLKAKAGDPKEADILYKFGKAKIDQYNNLKKQIAEANKLDNTEDVIYNHLTLFFSRYYDKGDFISKRRFGKSEKYVVPYNGEETHFYWANHDQYYIKSSEYFQKFSFKVKHSEGTLSVHFKLAEAQTEQGNVKADENKYFVLADKKPELQDDELNIFFEFRPLTEAEKKELSGNSKQDLLDEKAANELKAALSGKPITNELWKTDATDATLLLCNLHHYTRKNSYDFFIHKDLKGFLQRELDFYVKTELVKVEDLYVLDSMEHFENIRHNFKLIKCFKNIADTIIDFLAQIEDFQKKLWEKKKFVLATEWIITLDKLAAWLDKKTFETVLADVLKNAKQMEEWKQLFGEEVLPKWKGLKPEDLKADATTWRKLPIDTVHFHADFKTVLLTALSEKINLEEESNGLVIHSDNFHGLNILNYKYYRLIDGIHIDPPYNTDTSGFLYKNNYRDSSWLSMIQSRLENSIQLLNQEGSFLCHIDEFEYENLHHLFMKEKFPFIGTVIWDKKNPMMGGDGLAIQHEFILWSSQWLGKFESKSENVKVILKMAKEIIENNDGVNENARKEFDMWIKEAKGLTGGERMYNLLEDDGRVYQSVGMSWPNPNPAPEQFFKPLIHPITKKPCPVPPKGWSRSPEKMKELLDRDEIIFGKDEKTQPRRKIYLKVESKKPISTVLSNGSRGTKDLEKLGLIFSYCHPTSLYTELNFAITSKTGFLVDYFAGSGTSFHATQLLNKDDGGSRKCILIEQGGYFYTVILPRIKKIAYSFDWKAGNPQDMNGLGAFVKYHRLEQYEEALENIEFTASEATVQQALQLDTYLPKYFLNFETRGSQTLVNIAAMQDPWSYKLKVWDGFTYDTEQAVDLIETFNYLIGLHVQKYFERKHEGRRYVFVWGWDNDQKKSLVIWRSIKGWKTDDYDTDSKYLEAEIKKFEYDNLYINGQATVRAKYQMTEDVFKTRMIPA